jgi:hypothetical protein
LAAPPVFSSGIASLALLKDGWCGQGDSCFANYKTCPVLLAPRQDISRSLRTTDRALAKRGLADELENALKLDVKVGKLTLEELLRLYEEKLDKYAPKTIATRQSILKIFKETWPLGLNIPVHSVSTRQLGCQPQGG